MISANARARKSRGTVSGQTLCVVDTQMAQTRHYASGSRRHVRVRRDRSPTHLNAFQYVRIRQEARNATETGAVAPVCNCACIARSAGHLSVSKSWRQKHHHRAQGKHIAWNRLVASCPVRDEAQNPTRYSIAFPSMVNRSKSALRALIRVADAPIRAESTEADSRSGARRSTKPPKPPSSSIGSSGGKEARRNPTGVARSWGFRSGASPSPLSRRQTSSRTVRPIWLKTPRKAADQLRFIRAAIRWSIGNGHRADDPTTAVRDALPKQRRQTQHYAALRPEAMPAAMRALETCTRATKARPARDPVLLADGIETGRGHEDAARKHQRHASGRRAAQNTKSGKRDFVVPLSAAARAIIDEAARETGKRCRARVPEHGRKAHRRCDAEKVPAALRDRELDRGRHFSRRIQVWAAETGVEFYIAEMCLNHDVGSAVVKAYQRSDLLKIRTGIMERYCRHLLRYPRQ